MYLLVEPETYIGTIRSIDQSARRQRSTWLSTSDISNRNGEIKSWLNQGVWRPIHLIVDNRGLHELI